MEEKPCSIIFGLRKRRYEAIAFFAVSNSHVNKNDYVNNHRGLNKKYEPNVLAKHCFRMHMIEVKLLL